jgi:hypothetical protein
MSSRALEGPLPGAQRVTTAGEGAPAVTERRDAQVEPVVKGGRSGALLGERDRPIGPLASALVQGAGRLGFTTRGMVERLGGQLDLEDRTRGRRPDAFVRRGAGPGRPDEEAKMESRAPRDVLGDAMAAARGDVPGDAPCVASPRGRAVAAGGGTRCSSS